MLLSLESMGIDTIMIDAIIISDIHLGSDCCQAKALCGFLSWVKGNASKLILNGDVFDSINFHRLRKDHWKVLSKLRKMSDDIEIIWIAGNHDGPANILADLLGLVVKKEYVLESGGKRMLIVHGDKFDRFIVERPVLTWLADCIYWLLQKLDKNQRIARMAKQSSKTYLHCQEKIRREASDHAREGGYDAVCCGHVHSTCADGYYYNSGCWTEPPGTYLTVHEGEVNLHSYSGYEEPDVENKSSTV